MNQLLDRFDIDFSFVLSSKIKMDDCRLDPSFFSSNQSLFNYIETKQLKSFCDELFNPPVFKRDFINDTSECRYLASAEIVSLEPEIAYITDDQAKRLRLKVENGWILVTGFGTVGSIRVVDEIIKNYAVANNVTRIIPKKQYLGFIAAFLSSDFGNKLLNDHAAGAVVKYIEAAQIAKIPIPVLSETIVQETNELFIKVTKCREEAHLAIEQAKKLVLQYNNLPPILENQLDTLDRNKEVEIRSVNISEFNSDYRLDAHFYNPMAKKVIDNINIFSVNNQLLQELSTKIILGKRFKRNYVESEHGTPFLSGKNIIQIRPSDLKHLSNTEISFIDELQIKKNWTLITCSGTLGRTCFVYNNYENYAASQHIIRVVPNEELIDAGYLYCFLSTEYGYHQIVRNRYGSVIDEIDDKNMEGLIIPVAESNYQKEIGDLVRQAYDLRAEAIRLEDEAQKILTDALTGK